MKQGVIRESALLAAKDKGVRLMETRTVIDGAHYAIFEHPQRGRFWIGYRDAVARCDAPDIPTLTRMYTDEMDHLFSQPEKARP
jgi:hypothetical protein